jgi:hypothetical protein
LRQPRLEAIRDETGGDIRLPSRRIRNNNPDRLSGKLLRVRGAWTQQCADEGNSEESAIDEES